MPEVPAGDLTTLRTFPHASKLYMVVQQPMHQVAGNWTGYLWAGQINGAPAGTAGDLVASLTVDNGEVGDGGANVQLYGGMTIFIGTNKGDHDKGIYYLRYLLLADAATNTIPIGSSSEIVDNVEDDDWVTVLNEFRIWTRYPRITEAAGVISWFKDYNVTYAGLAGDAPGRREASLPPVPIMGPHRVVFIDQDDTVDIDFDWSDSYATYPGAATDTWTSAGQRGADSGDWNSALENPPAQTYDGTTTPIAENDISGLAGYRVLMRVQHDADDAPGRFSRGFRFVFTLRRPGEAVDGVDPVNAEPITDFAISSMDGSFDEGGWRSSITVFDSQASEISIIEGALVIIFADDYYGGTRESVGPISGAENILMCGYIADGSITQDPETGNVSFDVLSAAGIMKNREMYPIPIEYADNADEWYKCPNLTVDRAAWFYICWHSTVATVCDWYWNGDTEYIRAMDFLAGDLYSTLDSFYADRLVARLLCDRYGRFSMPQDIQLGVAGAGTTLFTLAAGDWLEEIEFRETIELPVSIAEMGGLHYDVGLIVPYLAKAPGTVNRQMGTGQSNMNLALADQATLNTWVGRWIQKLNNRWPESVFPFGNWRVFDIWPQEYINVTQETVRHDFSGDLFIPRNISMVYEGGSVSVTVQAELETDGPDGQTIEIPEEIPTRPIPRIPLYPPAPPPTPTNPAPVDVGLRILGTDEGVYYTKTLMSDYPIWIQTNSGFSDADDRHVWDIKRDPWHWWTSGGTERTLWALSRSGIWKMEDWPYGTWSQEFDVAALNAASGQNWTYCKEGRLSFSIEDDGYFAAVIYNDEAKPGSDHVVYAFVIEGGAIQNATLMDLASNSTQEWPMIMYAPHGASDIIYCAKGRRDPTNPGRLFKTVNGGGAWSEVNQLASATGVDFMTLSIPYVDASNPDLYVLWGSDTNIDNNIRISEDAGTSFRNLSGVAGATRVGTGGHPDYIFILTDRPDINPAHWSNTRGIGWNNIPLIPLQLDKTNASFVEWQSGVLQNVLLGDYRTVANAAYMYYWENGWGSWADKTGNLNVYSVTEVNEIQRDSMGSA